MKTFDKQDIREEVWRQMTEKYSGEEEGTEQVINWMNRNLKKDVDSLSNDAVDIAIKETARIIFRELAEMERWFFSDSAIEAMARDRTFGLGKAQLELSSDDFDTLKAKYTML